MKPLSPQNRRLLTYAAAGALSSAALRQAAKRSFQSAHYLTMAGTATLLAPTLIRNFSWFGPVITRFSTTRREVWITIDDGPHPENTPEILEVLSSHAAKATFFGIGERILQWPHLARAIKEAGHQLQNHTFRHPTTSYWASLPGQAAYEIVRCSEAILQVTGEKAIQFRAPAGLANPFVHAFAQKAGLQMIGWSARGLDGLPHQPERVVQKILHTVRPGAIILIHEGALRGLQSGTRARTLDMLLRELRWKGYQTVIPMLSR